MFLDPNMNFLGTLSPPSSSVDSSDANTNSPIGLQFSPGQIIYNATECTIMEDNGTYILSVRHFKASLS